MSGKRAGNWFAGFVVGLALTGCNGGTPSSIPVPEVEIPPEARIPPRFTGPSRTRLAAGETIPELRCVGWLNGEPRPFAPNGPKLHVVDVWSHWCPECHKFAPALAELKRKYADRGVQFLSVTDMPKAIAERYNQVGGIDWPSGYGLAVELIDELGAVNKGMAEMTRGYNIGPTIYVVGPDRKVVGSDESGRWRHMPRAEIIAKLEKVLDAALDASTGK